MGEVILGGSEVIVIKISHIKDSKIMLALVCECGVSIP